MVRSRRSLVVALVTFSSLFLVTFILFTADRLCRAHSPYTRPPMTPPRDAPGFGGPSSGGRGGPSTGGPSGPTTLGPQTPGPSGGSTGGGAPTPRRGGGSFTRRNRPAPTPTNTWEEWWARNRYQFLKFPGLEKDSRYTYTGTTRTTAGDAALMRSVMRSYRSKSLRILRLFLEDKAPRVLGATMFSLGRLDDDASIPQIIANLESRDMEIRNAAVIALGLSGNEKAHEKLVELIRNRPCAGKKKSRGKAEEPTDFMIGFAGLATALAGCSESGDLLRDVASDDRQSNEVRALALEGLGLLADEESARYLVEFTKQRKLPVQLLSTAVTALGKTRRPIAIPRLTRLLTTGKTQIKQSAALALGFAAPRGDPAAVSRLFQAFGGTTDKTLKGFALVSIGQVGGYEALKKLKLVLTRGTTGDLAWAALGYGIACHASEEKEGAGDLLRKFAKTRNRSTKGAIAIALGLAGCEDAVPVLRETLTNGDEPYLRGYCALALGMIGDESALPALREALLEKVHLPISTQAAMALCLMKNDDSCDDLRDMLFESKSTGVKAIASRGLVLIGNIDVADDLLTFIQTKHSDEDTYVFVIELISKLIIQQKVPYLDRIAACSNYTCEYPIMTTLLEYGI